MATVRMVKSLFIVSVLSFIMFVSSGFCAQKYYAFKLGKHVIEGNEIEFSFPMPPPSKAFYLFSSQWKLKNACKRARLVVNVYDKNRHLIGAGESMWANAQRDSTSFGHMTFGSAAIKGVTPDNIARVAYFSVYLQEPPGKNLTVLNDRRPEVRFAREVLSAIAQGPKAYLALFAGHPLSPKQKETAEAEFKMMREEISADLTLASVLPMKPSDAVSVRYACPAPFDMTFGPKYEHSEKTSDGGTVSYAITLSLPIGEVAGKWRLLLPE